MTVSAEIELYSLPHRTVFTNFDNITGNVTINLTSDTTIKSINVKLECIARTYIRKPESVILIESSRSGYYPTSISEEHTLIHQSKRLFPPDNMDSKYKLHSGTYNYPFSFEIPANSEYKTDIDDQRNEWIQHDYNGVMNSIDNFPKKENHLIGLASKTDRHRSVVTHINGPLPPSLSGLDRHGTIKYFIKVTIERRTFTLNTRVYKPFIFLPLDSIASYPSNEILRSQLTMGNFWCNIDVRILSNAFIPLCPLPLEIYINFSPSNNSQPRYIYISSIKFTLYTKTLFRVDKYYKEYLLHENLPSIYYNDENLSIPIDLYQAQPIMSMNEKPEYQLMLPDLLNGIQIPDHISPTFITCNIARSYAFKITIGFCEFPGGSASNVTFLRNITIASGIIPDNSSGDVYQPVRRFEQASDYYET